MAFVLVGDDDPDTRTVLRMLLTRAGHEVMLACDGPDTVAAARHRPPDVLLLDRAMPGMDGYQVCRMLRAHPSTRTVAIMLVSAMSHYADVDDGLAAGADDYLFKPFNNQDLLARVRALASAASTGDESRHAV
ncbi:response regulator [Actinoplanes sp. NPDC024001]|uniref:response regulator transcription factor n=1 Tax=Actinoplanes sp. NPDC024001 TaxID=3154598 RepID=UPI0033C87FF2